MVDGRELAAYVGEQKAFHSSQESFHFRAEFIDDLRRATPGPLTRAEQWLAVIAKGDEVLDWHEMTARYQNANIRLIEGSDHALSDFDEHLPAIMRFLKLCD